MKEKGPDSSHILLILTVNVLKISQLLPWTVGEMLIGMFWNSVGNVIASLVIVCFAIGVASHVNTSGFVSGVVRSVKNKQFWILKRIVYKTFHFPCLTYAHLKNGGYTVCQYIRTASAHDPSKSQNPLL